MVDNKNLRSLFNSNASDYDSVRPGYPDQLIDDIINFSKLKENGQLLEIGCGTGKATLPFAKRGYSILCLDIGRDLLAIAAENLRNYPNVQFEQVAFEDWSSSNNLYDLIFAATSFHWIPREIGYTKAEKSLKAGGTLAVFTNKHPTPYTGFFSDVQSIYEQYTPELVPRGDRPTLEAEIQEHEDYMRGTGLFTFIESRTYLWSITYTTLEYLKLLNTYIGHLAIDKNKRQCLYSAIGELIDVHYNGSLERPYLTELYLARK